MNNPNPFVPKGSLLEQQSQRRFRLKFAVGCVLAVSVSGLLVMLVQGCHRETPPADAPLAMDNTNSSPMLDNTNGMAPDTNAVAPYVPPAMTNTPPPPITPTIPPVETVAGSEYVVVKNDTLEKIAKKHGVTLKALQAANLTADSKHLKIGQKLTIPASTKSTDAAPTAVAGVADTGGESYTVKNNDTLTKIAKAHGISIKALKAANSLTTDHIKVGQKLKIPAKAEAAPAVAAPVVDTAPAPMVPPTTPAK